MAGADRRWRQRSLPVLLPLLAACASARYEPCPLRLGQPLPTDAFARCRAEMLRRYRGLEIVDQDAFLLQTGWVPTVDPVGERRASVFRTDDGNELGVVVELRWLETPWFSAPRWVQARGDAAAERELAEALRAALTTN